MTLHKAKKLIRQELARLNVNAAEANNAASALTDLILRWYPNLVSDVTVTRETATLLVHAGQNFGRIASAQLKQSTPQKGHAANASRTRRKTA